ncbi:type II secretion system GspH family protein [Patescibacteria group bacterium]|nr:type II secretion system GspH family protein [Patescibacteria group bacterium]MBU1966769.1 type II secretion system GspH family protein [Patescibacteria group bacterium]
MLQLNKKSPSSSGLTMIEILVVLAIIGVLILIFLMALGSPINRAKDARSKKHLFDLKVAFEEYYNDNYCYPPAEWFDTTDDCESEQFSPYINRIKCDPKTNLPYFIEYDATGCEWFKVYTNLYYPDEELCNRYGTGLGDFNYGVSATNTQVAVNCAVASPSPSASPSPPGSASPSPSPSASPSPSPSPEGDYYCQAIGNCTWYNATTWTCTPNYTTTNCNGECAWRTSACILD